MKPESPLNQLLVGSKRAEFLRNCSESDKSMKFGPDIVHMVLIKIRSGGTPNTDVLGVILT